MDSMDSGSVTPTEAFTPPNGLEAVVDIAQLQESKATPEPDTSTLISKVPTKSVPGELSISIQPSETISHINGELPADTPEPTETIEEVLEDSAQSEDNRCPNRTLPASTRDHSETIQKMEGTLGKITQSESNTVTELHTPNDIANVVLEDRVAEDIEPTNHLPEQETPDILMEDNKPIPETLSIPNLTVQIHAPESYDPHSPSSTRLRYLIKNLPRILVCPGVYDGLSARIALSLGFEGLYMTGAGTNASRLGMADLGIAHLSDMVSNASMISNLFPDGPPVIADMDTGYGGPMVIDRSLQQYHLSGVAGFHIEDQVLQKRCGHLKGKEVIDIETYISRIKACVRAATRLRSNIVVIARTDALQSRGYEDCIERLRRARDEGADMGILEGFDSKEQARQAVKDLAPWPLCLNSVENGVSPLISVREAEDMGFRVVIFSFASLAPAYLAIKETLGWLKKYGVTGSEVSPKSIFEVCGLRELMVIDEQAGGNSFVKGV